MNSSSRSGAKAGSKNKAGSAPQGGEKAQIRKDCRRKRRELAEEQVRTAGHEAAAHLFASPIFRKTDAILAYIDTQNELPTGEILAAAFREGKTIAVPRVAGETMDFYVISSTEDLEPGSFGILEPKASCPPYAGGPALMLVPGVAYDYGGHRIGYGGGFYDRYLAEHPEHETLGLAYGFQVYPLLPAEETDQSVGDVLTEAGFLGLNRESMRQQYYMDEVRTLIREREQKLGRPLTACVCTFGCQMNARDSEKLLGILREAGYQETDSEDADLVLYNTCTVRENANLRVYGRLGQLNSKKKRNPEMIIALCGCMMQEETVVEKIRTSFSFVDLIFGTHNIFKLAELLYRRLTGEGMVVDVWRDTDLIVEDLPVERKYPFKSGLNIMFGCNNFCTYCIVPYVRGRERSRNPEDIVREAERLVADGVKEIMLLGQNVNSYGTGLADPVTFAELLTRLEEIEGLRRIRFMTSHPKDLSDELIRVMASSQKICRHLHLPLQSGSSRILKQMNRRYDKESYLALVDRIRTAIPDISLTTDIIVGFPGETEEDFEDTLDVVRRVRYDSAFTFIYSKRTGTPAARWEQVPEAVTKERFNRLLALVQEIAAEECGRDTGKVLEALVEGIDMHDPNMITGRLGSNIMVHFPGDVSLIGEIVKVRLLEARGFYYMGRMEE